MNFRTRIANLQQQIVDADRAFDPDPNVWTARDRSRFDELKVKIGFDSLLGLTTEEKVAMLERNIKNAGQHPCPIDYERLTTPEYNEYRALGHKNYRLNGERIQKLMMLENVDEKNLQEDMK